MGVRTGKHSYSFSRLHRKVKRKKKAENQTYDGHSMLAKRGYDRGIERTEFHDFP